MSSTRSYLLPHEQEAIAREIDELLRLHGTQTEVGKLLGVSQAAVWKAVKQRTVGPDVARKVERNVAASVEALVAKHGLHPPAPSPAMTALDVAVAYLDDLIGPEAARRVRARAGDRQLKPYEWGSLLMKEQEDLIRDRATLGTPLSPASTLRRKP